MRVPKLMPKTVSSENEEGRRAWRTSTCHVGRPFERAMRMKSSWRVAIMSVRSSRTYTAMIPTENLILAPFPAIARRKPSPLPTQPVSSRLPSPSMSKLALLAAALTSSLPSYSISTIPVSLGWDFGSFLRTLICVLVIGTVNRVCFPDEL